MIRFRTRIGSVTERGGSRVLLPREGNPAGSAARIGEVVRGDLDGLFPKPREVAHGFARALKGARSEWPSAGTTANRGPQATGRSSRAFKAVQGRSGAGRFGSWQIVNAARNDEGRPYAGLVDSGIYNWRARPARIRANLRAVPRTWDKLVAPILEALARDE